MREQDVPWIPAFRASAWAPRGHCWPRVASCSSGRERPPATTRGQKAFLSCVAKRSRGRDDAGAPSRFPPPLSLPQGSPTRDGQIGLANCQALNQPTAPQGTHCLPVRRGQGSRGGPPTACHHTGQLSVTKAKVPSGNSGLPIKAWPTVTLDGPAARQEVHRRPF